jgi:hypothetical protein
MRLDQDGQLVANASKWHGYARRFASSRTMEEYDYSFAPPEVRIPEVPIWCIPFGYVLLAVLSGLTLPKIEARFLPGPTGRVQVKCRFSAHPEASPRPVADFSGDGA